QRGKAVRSTAQPGSRPLRLIPTRRVKFDEWTRTPTPPAYESSSRNQRFCDSFLRFSTSAPTLGPPATLEGSVDFEDDLLRLFWSFLCPSLATLSRNQCPPRP